MSPVKITPDGTVQVTIPKSLERRGRRRLENRQALGEVMAFAVTVSEADAIHADARRLGFRSVSRYLRLRIGLDKRKD